MKIDLAALARQYHYNSDPLVDPLRKTEGSFEPLLELLVSNPSSHADIARKVWGPAFNSVWGSGGYTLQTNNEGEFKFVTGVGFKAKSPIVAALMYIVTLGMLRQKSRFSSIVLPEWH